MLRRRPIEKTSEKISDFFFWLFALDSTLIKIVCHKLHWSTRLRLRGFVWHVQGCRRRATQEGGDEDMLRQSAEADGSVIKAPDGGGEWRYEGQEHPLRPKFQVNELI